MWQPIEINNTWIEKVLKVESIPFGVHILVNTKIVMEVLEHAFFLEFGFDVCFVFIVVGANFNHGFCVAVVQLCRVQFAAAVQDLSDVGEFALARGLWVLAEVLVL